jgi:hypothetical protein
MERIPNRYERRAMAKKAGYLKKKNNMSYSEKAELRRRSMEIGKEIHRQNTERVLREQEADEEQRKARIIQSRIEWLVKNEGLSIEEAQVKALKEYEKEE